MLAILASLVLPFITYLLSLDEFLNNENKGSVDFIFTLLDFQLNFLM
jgi:hypothetical protein